MTYDHTQQNYGTFSTCTTLEDEYRDYRLEKALLLSAFTVRLLLDANKLSDGIGSLYLKVDLYPAKKEAQKDISPLNKRFIDERYFDLTKSTSSSFPYDNSRTTNSFRGRCYVFI